MLAVALNSLQAFVFIYRVQYLVVKLPSRSLFVCNTAFVHISLFDKITVLFIRMCNKPTISVQINLNLIETIKNKISV